MKSNQLIAIAVPFLITVSACATTVTEVTPTSAETPLTRTATPIKTETTPSVTVTATQTGTPTNTPVSTEDIRPEAGIDETLMINNEGATPHLVDDQGRSLYVFLNDTQYGNTSACLDDCAVDWPPLAITGVPAAGEGVEIDQLGTLARPDGSKQVTFNGWPLYYFNQDTIPGTTYGQSYNGVWFLISPGGEPIQK